MTTIVLAILTILVLVNLLACLGLSATLQRIEKEHHRQQQLVDAFTQMVLAQQGLVTEAGHAIQELLRAYPLPSDATARVIAHSRGRLDAVAVKGPERPQ